MNSLRMGSIVILFITSLTVQAEAQQYTFVEPNPDVVQALAAAVQAYETMLDRDNLIALEEGLTTGIELIQSQFMGGEYAPATQRYLEKRGWRNLVWHQIFYRLRAFQSHFYEAELAFADDVYYADEAHKALTNLETSLARLEYLFQVGKSLGAENDIDNIAQTIVPDYRETIAEFRGELARRGELVLARLDQVEIKGSLDPVLLADDALLTERYEVLHARLQGKNLINSILDRLVTFDPDMFDRLLEVADTAKTRPSAEFLLNISTLQAITLEEALVDAQLNWAALQESFDWAHEQSHVLNPQAGCEVGERDLVQSCFETEDRMTCFTDPYFLRDFYAKIQQVHQLKAAARDKPMTSGIPVESRTSVTFSDQ